MSNNHLITGKKAIDIKALEKQGNNAMYEAMIKDAKENALSLVSDDQMEVKEYEEEHERAKLIISGAIATIMRNCNFYGDDSIYQTSNAHAVQGDFEVNSFFGALVEEVANESFNIKS